MRLKYYLQGILFFLITSSALLLTENLISYTANESYILESYSNHTSSFLTISDLNTNNDDMLIVEGRGWANDSIVQVHFQNGKEFHICDHCSESKVNSQGAWTYLCPVKNDFNFETLSIQAVGIQSGINSFSNLSSNELSKLDKEIKTSILP